MTRHDAPGGCQALRPRVGTPFAQKLARTRMRGSQFHYSALLGCFLCLADGSAVGAQSADQSTSGAAVVQRVLARPDEPLTRYRALRRLEARNSRFDVEGWLEGGSQLTPDGRVKYKIVPGGGRRLNPP